MCAHPQRPDTERPAEPVRTAAKLARHGGSGARGRRDSDRVSGRRRGRACCPRARAFRLVALVAAGTRAAGGASPCLPGRPAAARARLPADRADRLARPLARRRRSRVRRSDRAFARRPDRRRVRGRTAPARAAACARRPGGIPCGNTRAQSRRTFARDALRRPRAVTDGRRRRTARRAVQPPPRGPRSCPTGT